MSGRPYISIILPAFNERMKIVSTIEQVHDYFSERGETFQIIVAADGEDGTREAARNFAEGRDHILVIGHHERVGKGRGIREAMSSATGENVGFMDADNKTPISEFEKFKPYLDSGCDLVIGSRALKESRIEREQCWYRRLGSKGFGVLVRNLLDLHGIQDTQCGFKFFKREVAYNIFRRQKVNGYMFDIEILYLALMLGYNIQQVPVRWQDDADSRLELFKGNLRNIIDVIKIRVKTSVNNDDPAWEVADESNSQ